MENQETQDPRERLIEIKVEMLELLEEAKDIIPEGIKKERAKCYWYAHIKTAIEKEHGFLGGSMVTMEDTINELLFVDDDMEGE
jgi:hypothetical protein